MVEAEKILNKNECYEIQGAVFEVYKEIGAGFLESVYQECLEVELGIRGIAFRSQYEMQSAYKNFQLNSYFKADILGYESIMVELKSCKVIEPNHRAQIINYLKATRLGLGLLVNFSSYPKVEIERIIV